MSTSTDISDLLPLYYKRLFPYAPYCKWISYGNVDPMYFKHREFSFTLADDIYVRYQSFDSQDEFEKKIKKTCPYKIDIGAIYTLKPIDNRMRTQFQPLEKELVFDIDMTDYDDIRTCCSGADVCCKCWKYMAIACKVLEAALMKDFGWKHLLWVFSGRRGIHCWVCDESARILDTSARLAVAEYLQLLTGGVFMSKKVSLQSDVIHPSIVRALNIIDEYFVNMSVEEQNMLGTGESCRKFLSLILDDNLKEDVEAEINKYTTSLDRWNAFLNIVNIHRQQGLRKTKSKHIVEEIKLQYAYPRLDINVSKGLGHLLKSPFCVHPKTGKICVPFHPRNVDNFDPSSVPTIGSLIDEITQYDKKVEEQRTNEDSIMSKLQDYKKTSLNKSVTVFNEFLRPMEEAWKTKRLVTNDRKMEF